MRKYIFILVLLTGYLNADEIEKIKPDFVCAIKYGTGPGQILTSNDLLIDIRYPTGVLFDYDKKLYISDPVNNRINIYDYSFKYLGEIKVKFESSFTKKLFPVNSNYFFAYQQFDSINCFDKNFNVLWKLSGPQLNDSLQRSEELHGWWYVLGDHFYIYRKNIPMIIDKNGNILGNTDTRLLLKKWRNESAVYKNYGIGDKLNNFLDNNKVDLYDDMLLTCDVRIISEYFSIISSHTTGIESDGKIWNKIINTAKYFCYEEINSYFRDIHKNLYYIYWDGALKREVYLILTKYGKIIKHFIFDFEAIGLYNMTILPNGDIIFNTHYVTTETNVYHYDIYKIKNTWDPITDKEVEDYRIMLDKKYGGYTPTPEDERPYLAEIRASSFLTEPFDKNAYHPVKVLDNDIKTMWIEGKDGPGIGESIYIEFKKELTIDEIEFWPGCFYNAEYWKKNYRLKKILLILGNNEYNIEFEDKMQSQRYKLDNPHTFHNLIVEIKEVYPTGYWEDTALSEIKFYYQGKEIKINTVLYENFLLKDPVALLKKGIEYLVSGIKYFFAAAENYKAG